MRSPRARRLMHACIFAACLLVWGGLARLRRVRAYLRLRCLYISAFGVLAFSRHACVRACFMRICVLDYDEVAYVLVLLSRSHVSLLARLLYPSA